MGRPVSRTRLPRAPRQARGSDVWVSGLPTASQTTADPKELLPTQVRPRDTYCINDYGQKSGGLEETAAHTPSAVRVRTPCCTPRTRDRQRGRRTASPRPGRPGLAKSSPAAGQHGRRHPRKALVPPSWSPGRAGRRAVRSPAQALERRGLASQEGASPGADPVSPVQPPATQRHQRLHRGLRRDPETEAPAEPAPWPSG